jgi:hypothetical protein
MNALSKFSLMMAFSTALFCLLMLSRGFAKENTVVPAQSEVQR